jgi:LPS-assembly lipoprotein
MLWFRRQSGLLSGFVVITVVLSSCGFHLQGVGGYPDSMAKTYIDAEDRYTPFYRKLRVALEQGGVTLAASPIDADAVIRIEKDDTGQKVLTISGRNIPTEYNVYYKVSYSVWVGGQEVRSSHKLKSSQDYNYDSELVLGKAREAEMLQSALADKLVAQVSRELSSIE